MFKVVSPPLFEALSFSGLLESVPMSLHLVLLLCSRCSQNISRYVFQQLWSTFTDSLLMLSCRFCRAVHLVCAIRTSTALLLSSSISMQCGQARDGFHGFGYKNDF